MACQVLGVRKPEFLSKGLSFRGSRSGGDGESVNLLFSSPTIAILPQHHAPPHLKFRWLPGPYAIVRLAPDAPIPAWATKGDFTSITRTADELSIVCPTSQPSARRRTRRTAGSA